jgi:hypothetical protein
MSRQLFEEARKVLTQEAAVKLDPVGQEDKDIDNDGDADKTDSYLKKRRGAISAAIAKSKNESALSEEDLAKLKAILGEMKKKEEMEDEEEDEEDEMEDEKKMKNEGMQKAQVPPKGPKPEEVPAYMRKGNARQKFPLELADLKRKNEETELQESDGPVVWKKGDHSIEKMGDTSFALYVGDKKMKTFSSLDAAKGYAMKKEEVESVEEAKLNPAGKAAVRNVTKKIGTKTLGQTKAIVALAKMDPKKVKEEVEQINDETVSEGRPYSAMHRIGRYGSTRRSSDLDLGGRREVPPAPKPTAPAPKPPEDKKKNEETEQIDEISQALKNRVQDARRGQFVTQDLGYSPFPKGHEAPPVSTATKNRLLQRVGGKGNELYAKNVLRSHLDKRSRGDLKAAESYELEELEQIDEVGDTPAGRQMLAKYINKAARRVGVHSAIATDYSSTADDNTASPAQRMAATTLAAQQKHKRNMRLRGVERATNRLTQEEIEQEDFELIENLNFALPEHPSYQDFIKAALTIAECNSFSELSEEDQQYIISEMEDAFRNNDLAFIAEAEALSDMNDTVQRLRKAGHRIEDMGKDYKGQPYYVYVDKGTGLRRKVTYKGNQKVTQNMGKAAPEDTNEA